MDLGSDLAQVYLLRGQKPIPDGVIRWSPGTRTAGLGSIIRINSTFFGIKKYLNVDPLDILNELFYALPSGMITKAYEIGEEDKIVEIKKQN